jgi:hypothetical protein
MAVSCVTLFLRVYDHFIEKCLLVSSFCSSVTGSVCFLSCVGIYPCVLRSLLVIPSLLLLSDLSSAFRSLLVSTFFAFFSDLASYFFFIQHSAQHIPRYILTLLLRTIPSPPQPPPLFTVLHLDLFIRYRSSSGYQLNFTKRATPNPHFIPPALPATFA